MCSRTPRSRRPDPSWSRPATPSWTVRTRPGPSRPSRRFQVGPGLAPRPPAPRPARRAWGRGPGARSPEPGPRCHRLVHAGPRPARGGERARGRGPHARGPRRFPRVDSDPPPLFAFPPGLRGLRAVALSGSPGAGAEGPGDRGGAGRGAGEGRAPARPRGTSALGAPPGRARAPGSRTPGLGGRARPARFLLPLLTTHGAGFPPGPQPGRAEWPRPLRGVRPRLVPRTAAPRRRRV